MPNANQHYVESEIIALAGYSGSGDSGVLESYADFLQLRLHALIDSVDGGASGTVTFTVEDSVDGTNWTAVTTALTMSYSGGTVDQAAALSITVPFAQKLRVRYVVSSGTVHFKATLEAKR